MQQLVEAQLNAYNSRDLSKFCECYHEEVLVVNLLSGRVGAQGKNSFKQLYQKLFETSPNLKCEIKSRIILENSVIDEEWVVGIQNFPQGLHAVAIYGFRDQLIDRVWFPKS